MMTENKTIIINILKQKGSLPLRLLCRYCNIQIDVGEALLQDLVVAGEIISYEGSWGLPLKPAIMYKLAEIKQDSVTITPKIKRRVGKPAFVPEDHFGGEGLPLLREAKAQGLYAHEIATKFTVSITAVNVTSWKYGITRNPSVTRDKETHPLKVGKWASRREELQQMLQQGLSREEIAEYYGTCYSTISAAIGRLRLNTDPTIYCYQQIKKDKSK